MFSKNDNAHRTAPPARRGRGRPPGRTPAGEDARRRLYETAIRLIAVRGYEVTTLRDIAKQAGVSPGLLYRYFPGKRAVVLALYEDLSAKYATRAAKMAAGPWAGRFLFALETSLAVLARHRSALAALSSVLLGGAEAGIFAPATAASRHRVEAVFVEAVRGAADAPPAAEAVHLGRLLYFAHLAIILWWLLDKSPRQRATRELIALLSHLLPLAAPVLTLAPSASIETLARLCEEGPLGASTVALGRRRAGRG